MTQRPRLDLVKPNMGRTGDRRYRDSGKMEPLQLGVLAGMTPPEWDVHLLDDRCEDVRPTAATDLAALTVETFTAKRAYEIAEDYHRAGVPVVIGGMHPTLIPEEAARHADAVVTGDAEAVWPEVLADAARGALRPRYHGHTAAEVQEGRFPRRELFAGKGYLPVTLLQFSRGCPHTCRYCATSVFFGKRHRTRDPQEVVEEIRAQRRRYLFFVDDNIVADKEAAKELFAALVPLKVRWVSQASIDMLDDPELMELMVRSGCQGNVIGFESITPESLKGMRKAVNRAPARDLYAEAVERLRRYHLQTWAAFTLGHDADTIESIRATVDFAIASKFTFAAYNILMPYPGTPLYASLEAKDRLLMDGRWWLHPDFRFNHAAFRPANMSPAELTRWSFWARARTNSVTSILRRAAEPRTNLRSPFRFAQFAAYNPLFRTEVFKKQGMSLGYRDLPAREWSDGGARAAAPPADPARPGPVGGAA